MAHTNSIAFFLLLAVFHLGRGAEYPLDDPQALEQYERTVGEFQSRADRVFQELNSLRDAYFAALELKVDSRLAEQLVRSKRDTTGQDDFLVKMNKAFNAVKDSMQTAMSDVSKTELFKDAQSKLKEFGDTISEAGKKFGEKMQTSMKDVS